MAFCPQQCSARSGGAVPAVRSPQESSGAPIGSKIGDIQINGVPIHLNASYRIATNNFLADGGDRCTIFREGTERLAGIIDLEALVAYFGAHSPLAPDPRERITFVP